jgi:hypothetical protein
LIQLTPPTNTQLITVTKKDANMLADINNLLKVFGAAAPRGDGRDMVGVFDSDMGLRMLEKFCARPTPGGGATQGLHRGWGGVGLIANQPNWGSSMGGGGRQEESWSLRHRGRHSCACCFIPQMLL